MPFDWRRVQPCVPIFATHSARISCGMCGACVPDDKHSTSQKSSVVSTQKEQSEQNEQRWEKELRAQRNPCLPAEAEAEAEAEVVACRA